MKNLLLLLSMLLSFSVSAKNVVVKFGTVAPAGTPWADTLDEIKKASR